MRKTSIVVLAAVTALSAVVLFQLQTTARLRRELADARAENARLRDDLAARDSGAQGRDTTGQPTEAVQIQMQQLESEVMRLRGAASRALRAETELAQLKAQAGPTPPPAAVVAPSPSSPGSSSEPLVAYLGDPVPPPPNLDPAYGREGLINAIQQAAANAGVTLKKLEIETSEFPFLAGVICADDAEFEKLKEQLKKTGTYDYTGAVSSHGVYSFGLIPYRTYPPGTGQLINRRTTLRRQMFFDQLNTGQP
jgi:hypothetical protein